ncbi:hypothetical protein ACVR0D_03590 [Streptococcus cristatus]|uniref:hypothetical protein n=1 Tax=Streptococcus cristatus TaxID=45634 RepID=UPI000A74AB63|nr:hypothetical protein [Streptococcus cristatus]
MEEFLNLYHQKLWEIAFGNIVGTFFNFYTIVFVLLIYPYYILSDLLARRWKRLLVMICPPFILFLLCMVAEYAHSYDKIMNPASPYNDSLRIASVKPEKALPILEHVDEIRLASVDGELKREDIILFAVSNPIYYDGLFADVANSLAGSQTIGAAFLVALVGYEEKDGEWQSVDIRIAPGVEEKDFQKFSKVLHIKIGEAEGATGIILDLQRLLDLQELYEKKLQKEKDGH